MHLTGMPYIAGTAKGRLHQGVSDDPVDKILVLRQTEFRPSANLPSGFLVIDGAPFAHTSIPLLGTGLPTIFIDSAQAARLPYGSEVYLDGTTGRVTTETAYATPVTQADHPSASTTRDGVAISLRVSIRDMPSLQRAATSNADAIGLVRSEFLLPDDGSLPDTEYYRQVFRSIAETALPMPVTIRLLDIGGDKIPPWLPRFQGIGGPLGQQGVRLFAEEPVTSVIRSQLTAIDELSEKFDLRVLIPFLSNRDEVQEWTSLIQQQFSKPIALGAMAETPAAVLQISDWFDQVDFVALGCNDLMQCLFGADRDRAELRRYLDPYSPSLFRFLRQVAIGAADHLQNVQLCGVLSQLPGILPVLIGLGFRAFSVENASLPYLRQTIASISAAQAKEQAQQVCAAESSTQARQLIITGKSNSG